MVITLITCVVCVVCVVVTDTTTRPMCCVGSIRTSRRSIGSAARTGSGRRSRSTTGTRRASSWHTRSSPWSWPTNATLALSPTSFPAPAPSSQACHHHYRQPSLPGSRTERALTCSRCVVCVCVCAPCAPLSAERSPEGAPPGVQLALGKCLFVPLELCTISGAPSPGPNRMHSVHTAPDCCLLALQTCGLGRGQG